MAAPTPVARVEPTGRKLDNGFRSTIAFTSNATLDLWETSITPSKVDGGDPIMTDTMWNDQYITKSPQCLEEWQDFSVTGQYDPDSLPDFQALINDPQAISYYFPTGTVLTWWGYLRSYEFSPLVKGTPPTLTLTIVVTNYDPVHCVEAGPILTPGTGSCIPC